MKIAITAALLAFAATSATAFVVAPRLTQRSSRTVVKNLLDDYDANFQKDINKQMDYAPGDAETQFAKRFKHLAGQPVKTVGEAFADFTQILGHPVNALYKNMVTDIVGSTHLIVVNARFQRDAIWCLGIIEAMELLLKNYPEKNIASDVVSALFQSIGMDQEEVRAEAKTITDWAAGKTKEDVEAALRGEGNSPIAAVSKAAKADEFWMYSRFFGIGLVKVMELVNMDMTADDTYPIMEDWMGNQMGKSHYTACSDSDTYFKIKSKLEMMETLMREIEIREKKRMAERLELRAEDALRMAEKEVKMQKEIEADEAKKADVEKVDVEKVDA